MANWTGAIGKTLTLALALTLATSGHAVRISVDPVVVILEQSSTDEIIVTNDSNEVGFVTARPRIVTAPGEPDEKLLAEVNPAVAGLLVTPLRMALEPGERRAVRLRALNPPGSSDRIWRVQVAPAVGELKPGQSGIAFLVAYDALVIQRAANPRIDLSGKRDGKRLTLTNGGNTFAMVVGVEQCNSAGNCSKLPGRRLYGGDFWSVDLPYADRPAQLLVEGVGRKTERLKF